jgi:hypothetical protein
MHAENPAPDLPPYSLDVQAMDLGPGTKAVGLELIETESREPLRGSEAASIWAAALVALSAKEPYVVDFFSHLERVREFCASRSIAIREAASSSKHLVGVSARPAPIRTRLSSRNCRIAAWTPIKLPTRATPAAPFASSAMLGSPYSAIRCGPPR